MLIERKSQSEICKFLRKDKAQISRMVNRLIDGGYIYCFNPQSRDKIYVATKKHFNAKEVYKLPSSKSQRLHGRCNIIQIQKSSFVTDVKSVPKNNIKWDKEWDINGLHYQQYSFPFPNVGEIKFQRFSNGNVDRLKIILPRLAWDKSDGKPEPFLREVADRAGTWFMHHFKVELVGLSVCQNPDYAILPNDSKIISLAQNGTFSNGRISIDSSKPDELPEVESKDFDLINGISNAPDEIRRLKADFMELKSIVVSIKDDVVELKSMFGGRPVLPDERRDVT